MNVRGKETTSGLNDLRLSSSWRVACSKSTSAIGLRPSSDGWTDPGKPFQFPNTSHVRCLPSSKHTKNYRNPWVPSEMIYFHGVSMALLVDWRVTLFLLLFSAVHIPSFVVFFGWLIIPFSLATILWFKILFLHVCYLMGLTENGRPKNLMFDQYFPIKITTDSDILHFVKLTHISSLAMKYISVDPTNRPNIFPSQIDPAKDLIGCIPIYLRSHWWHSWGISQNIPNTSKYQ